MGRIKQRKKKREKISKWLEDGKGEMREENKRRKKQKKRRGEKRKKQV